MIQAPFVERAFPLKRLPFPEFPITAALVACAAGLAVLGGLLTSMWGPLALAAAIALAWAAIMRLKWRSAGFVLLYALPFASLPGILMRQSGWPTLLKDVVIILPLYAGFIAAALKQEVRWQLPRSVVAPLVTLLTIVIFQAAHEATSSPLVALIGLKTWLFYIPLILLADLLMHKPRDLTRLLRVIVVIALLPSMFGIIEAVLMSAGHSSIVYGFYGSLARNVTQDFAAPGFGNGLAFYRIPSVFYFVSQFFGFSFTMLPLSAGIWLYDPSRRWRRFGITAMAVIALGGLASGTRSFAFWLPIEIALVFVFTGGRRRAWLTIAALVVVVVAAFGNRLLAVGDFVANLSLYYVGLGWQELASSVQARGLLGAGLGTQTHAIRYVLAPGSLVGIGTETWYAKVLYEVGLPGLAAVLWLWTAILATLWTIRSRLLNPTLRGWAGIIFVFALAAVLNLFKTPNIDLDPVNVYFWFFVGLGLALPRIDAATRASSELVVDK